MTRFKASFKYIEANTYHAPSGQRYTFFNNQWVLVEDPLDVEYFRKKKSRFVEENMIDKIQEVAGAISGEPVVKIVEDKSEGLGFLGKIKGVGEKTVKDLSEIYKTRSELKAAIERGDHIPVRDDVAKKIRRFIGGI